MLPTVLPFLKYVYLLGKYEELATLIVNTYQKSNKTHHDVTSSTNTDFFFLTFFVDAMAAQLNSVRMKLEQRRKRIEEEKRKMETVMAKQREKVGQEAFLRAVVKGTVIRLTSN